MHDAFYFQLTIRVTDVNDNAPKFELPDYQAHNVDEDIPLGTSILKVKATDADSGSNAEIEYLVSDDHFSVDSSGIITNTKQLDADNNNAYYEFVVTAKDKGLWVLLLLHVLMALKVTQCSSCKITILMSTGRVSNIAGCSLLLLYYALSAVNEACCGDI
jgi:hypothetical protein